MKLVSRFTLILLCLFAKAADAGQQIFNSGPFTLTVTDSPVGADLTQYRFHVSISGANPINSIIFTSFAPASVHLTPTNGQGQPLPTLFMDNNAAIPASFPGRNANEDSQFRLQSSETQPIFEAGQPPRRLTFEDNDELAGVLVFTGPQRFFSRDVAQVVLPNGAGGVFNFQAGSVDASGQGIGAIFRGPTGPVIPGDADLNGIVSFADFQRLERNFANPGDWRSGDFNFDGQTNAADFLLLRQNFPAAADSIHLANVPEPHSVALILAISATAVRRARFSARNPRAGVPAR